MSKVIVFGSLNVDCVATVERHPRPGETVPGLSFAYYPGGKGSNQAIAAARLGAKVCMAGRVGHDGFASFLLDFLGQEHIDLSGVTSTDGPTGTALISVDQKGENSIIVIPSANGTVQEKDSAALPFSKGDILVCQNEIPAPAILAAFRRAKESGVRIVYNPAPAVPMPQELFDLADIVIVNEHEQAFYEKNLNPAKHVLVKTLGSRGVCALADGKETVLEGYRVNVVDTTGAGDCFTGAFAAALSEGKELREALAFANKAASIAVQRPGAGSSMPMREEIDAV